MSATCGQCPGHPWQVQILKLPRGADFSLSPRNSCLSPIPSASRSSRMLDQGPEGAEREKQVVEGSYCEGLNKRRNPYEAFVSRAQKEY